MHDHPRDFLHLFYSERLAVAVEGLEEAQCVGDEGGRYPNVEATCVEELPQEFVNERDHHSGHLIERDRVLPFG